MTATHTFRLSALVWCSLAACQPVGTLDEAEPTAATPRRSAEDALPSLPPWPTEAQLKAARAKQGERATRALAEVNARFKDHVAGLAFELDDVRTDPLGRAQVSIRQVFQGLPLAGRNLASACCPSVTAPRRV